MLLLNRDYLSTILASLVLMSSVAHSLAGEPIYYPSAEIKGVPHVKQKPDFCGEACIEMYTSKLGHKITQDDAFNFSGLTPSHGRGCYTKELSTALNNIGFKQANVSGIMKAGSEKNIRALWKLLHDDLTKGIPSIICMRYDKSQQATEHFRLILGYDATKDEVIYNEPAEDDGAYRRMSLDDLLSCWPLKYTKDTWTVIRFRLEPGKIVKPEKSTKRTDADYAQHIMTLKSKIPNKNFTMVLEKPFVVIGDEDPGTVKLRAVQTVKWATMRLKNMYFKQNPNEIYDIWLFKNKASYRKYTWEIFKDKPDTPFGYASDEHHALIMNIGTGGGTLVHEIVHPFVAANFPECPSWLNEGLGSLYEQSSGKGNNLIIGLTNWRLPDLQTAIKNKELPSFLTLTSTSTYGFYSEDPGTNYAQARYLCFYLQEQGLLTKFYHKFRANSKKDPTGYNTLKDVLGEKDMTAFQKKWEKYVLKLRFPSN